METVNSWKEIAFNSFNKLGLDIADSLDNILGAVLVLLFGWIVTKIIVFLLKRILRLAKVDKITDMINEKDVFGKTDLTFNITTIIISFTKWLFLSFKM